MSDQLPSLEGARRRVAINRDTIAELAARVRADEKWIASAEGRPEPADALGLYAWIGLDEYGSGEVGLKQALTPSGRIPVVAIRRDKIDRVAFADQLQIQASRFGVAIHLARFVEVETVKTLAPRP